MGEEEGEEQTHLQEVEEEEEEVEQIHLQGVEEEGGEGEGEGLHQCLVMVLATSSQPFPAQELQSFHLISKLK